MDVFSSYCPWKVNAFIYEDTFEHPILKSQQTLYIYLYHTLLEGLLSYNLEMLSIPFGSVEEMRQCSDNIFFLGPFIHRPLLSAVS